MARRQTGPAERHARKTLLLVGEGADECGFLQHLKRLYVARGSGVAVTIRNAHGKGPEHVVDFTVRQTRNAAYDIKAALLDTDLVWPPRVIARARRERVLLLASDPCLDGLLLQVLERPVPAGSAECKAALRRLIPEPADRESYRSVLTPELIEQRRAHVPTLEELVGLMTAPPARA
jgi:hypothetical protein